MSTVDQAHQQQVEVTPAGDVEVLDSAGHPAASTGQAEANEGGFSLRAFLDTLGFLIREAPVTMALLAGNILIFLLYNEWIGSPPVTWAFYPAGDQGFPQILSYLFVHGNWAHLLVNMLVIFSFGVVVERIYGSLRYTVLYVVAGVLAALAQLLFDHNAALIGASGAAAALLAVFVRFFPRERVLLFFVPLPAWIAAIVIVAINVFGSVTGGVRGSLIAEPNIGYFPHLAGLAVGLLWAFLVRPGPSGREFINHVRDLSQRA